MKNKKAQKAPRRKARNRVGWKSFWQIIGPVLLGKVLPDISAFNEPIAFNLLLTILLLLIFFAATHNKN